MNQKTKDAVLKISVIKYILRPGYSDLSNVWIFKILFIAPHKIDKRLVNKKG